MSESNPYDLVARVGSMREAEITPQRAELRRLAEAARLMIERMVATKAPAEDLSAAADALEAVAASLEGFPRGHLFQGFGESANSGDPHAHFDHSPIIGRSNPLAPPLVLDVVEGKVAGTATFGSAYEGPPGAVHGGHVAAAFDELLGMAQSLGGQPGMTGTLTIRYRRPHPLHVPISFEAELVRVEGRKIFTVGRSFAGGELRAEAEGIFITVDFSKIAELMRGAPDSGAGSG